MKIIQIWFCKNVALTNGVKCISQLRCNSEPLTSENRHTEAHAIDDVTAARRNQPTYYTALILNKVKEVHFKILHKIDPCKVARSKFMDIDKHLQFL